MLVTKFNGSLGLFSAVLFALAAASETASAQTHSSSAVNVMDRATFQSRLKALGHKKRGGIDHGTTESTDSRYRSLPHFSSSFTVNG